MLAALQQSLDGLSYGRMRPGSVQFRFLLKQHGHETVYLLVYRSRFVRVHDGSACHGEPPQHRCVACGLRSPSGVWANVRAGAP